MKLVIFDMDETLLQGRTILFLASEFGFYERALGILEDKAPKKERSRRLAKLLKGIKINDFLKVIEKIPLTTGAVETVQALRERGYKTAIITDSYDIVADHFRDRLGMDRAVGIKLKVEKGVITGEVEMPLNCRTPSACSNPSICKRNILRSLAEEFSIPLSETVAVGDNQVDICMIKEAGLGIAFQPKVKELEDAADLVIREGDLRVVLRNINIK